MDKVRLWESACEQAIQMVSPSQDTDISTNAVGTKQGSGNMCFNCGKVGHFACDLISVVNGRKYVVNVTNTVWKLNLWLQGRTNEIKAQQAAFYPVLWSETAP